MSTIRILRFLTVGLLVIVLALWAFALTGAANPLGLPSPGSEPPHPARNEAAMRKIVPLGASDTQNGVTLSIVQAEFSSSETRLLLEVAGLAKDVSYKQFSLGTTLVLQNAKNSSLPTYTESAQLSDQGNPRGLFAFGPVADVTKPVILTVAYTLESPDAVAPASTWRLSFVPGKDAADPINTFLRPDQKVDYGRMSITVRGVHISSSQVSVYYDVSVPEGAVAEPVTEVAELVYADGTTVLGDTEPQFREKLHGGSEKVVTNDPLANASQGITFPLMKSPSEKFQVRFGQYILSTPSARELVIPLGENASRISSDQGVFDISASSDESGAIIVRAQRVGAADPGGFIVWSADESLLQDDLGNTYSFIRGENGFRKAPDTEPVADRTILVFAGPLDKNARELRLSLPDVADVVEPVDQAEVSVP